MNFKRKTAVLWLAILMVAAMTPGWTAEAATNAEMPVIAEPSEENYDSLRLTDDQKQQIKPVMQERTDQISQVMHDPSLTPQEKWVKADDIRAQSRLQVDQYLTPEQKAKADPVRSENDVQRGKVRQQQEKVMSDNQKLKEDRKQLHEDRVNDNKQAAQDDKDKVREDRQQRANDRIDRHQIKQQGKEDRRDRRQANRG